jgi:hypothetical protein
MTQHGISKPKSYNGGTIRYGLVSSVGEPTIVHQALSDSN